MKNKISLLVLLFAVGTQTMQAQVKGISYTLSPSIEYSNWGKNTGLSDGYSVGGQFGFGFGQFVELRANYLQSINLQRDFSNFDFDNINNSLLAEQDVTVRRYGGELKLNLAKGGIVPFLTAGAGIQNIERSMIADSASNRKNIFFSGGGGLQFSLGDRYTLAIQAVNTSFNGSPVRNLIDELEQAEIGVDGVNFENVAISNWSYRASILLYLGGRRPGEMTDADKAYVENFTNDFRGISLPIEITAGQINFGDGLPYADTKFTGVSSGFNFGPYVGIRAFYLRSMEDGYFSSFNRLALYGGEGKFKLSTGQGVAPYLNVGGGVIDPLSGFTLNGVAADEADNTPFVSGGVGLDLPLSRNVKVSGYAKALLTSNDLTSENINPDELTTSMMYGLSANFILGARSKDARKIVSDNKDAKTYDEMVAKSMEEEKDKADRLKKEYNDRINKLDKEVDKAYKDGDLETMQKKFEERETAQRLVNRIAEIEKKEAEANKMAEISKMNPSEFSKMMEELQKSQEKSQEQLNDRLDAIEKSLKGNNNRADDAAPEKMTQRERELQGELDDLKKQLNKNEKDTTAVMSDREKVLQKEADDLRKQLRKTEKKAENTISDREKELEKELSELRKAAAKKTNSLQSEMSDTERKLEKEIKELKEQLNEQPKTTPEKKSNDSEPAVGFRFGNKNNRTGNQNELGEEVDASASNFRLTSYLTESQLNYQSENLPAKEDSSFFSRFNYDGSSAIGGFNLGGNTTLNVGVRTHYRYRESNFYVVPEAFFGFGNPASFGLFANAVYQLNLKQQSFAPYIGAGAGVLNIGEENDTSTKAAINFVIGSYLFKVGNGRFYADFSARNLFKYNQIVAGYRLPF